MNPQNQDPQFSHQNDDYAQQQAEVQRQMQQILASPDPMQHAAKPKRTIGILALIFSVILPPIGMILAIISIFKGFTSQRDKILGFMGVGSLILGALMSLVLIVAISSSTETSSNNANSTSEGEKAAEYSFNGVSLQLAIPEGFEEVENTTTYINWESEHEAFTDRMSLSVAPLESSQDEQILREATTPEDVSTVWANTILLNDLSECTEPTVTDVEVEAVNVKEVTQSSYECEVTSDEGEASKFKGRYVSIITSEDEEIIVHYFIQEKNWNVPSDVAEQVAKTVRIEKEANN